MSKTHPSQRVIAAAVRANVPLLIEGMPGEAKSASLESWMEAWNRHCEVITMSSRDKGDFMGIPLEDPEEQAVVYSPMSWVRRLQNADGPSALIIDEFNTAGEAFPLALRIVQERVVGEAQLPDSTSIIAIANPVEVAVNGDDLPAPISNRFVHVDWYFDFEAWAHGLLTDFVDVEAPSMRSMLAPEAAVPARWAKVAASIIAFLQRNPGLRNDCPTDPAQGASPWPSIRSWTNAAKVIAHLRDGDEDAMNLALKGAVGEGAAREYLAWLATADLIDPQVAMDDPSQVDWSGERADRLFVLVNGVASLALQDGEKTTWRKAMGVLVACAEGGKPDVATPSARTLLARMPAGAQMPAGTAEAFSGLIRRMPAAVAV